MLIKDGNQIKKLLKKREKVKTKTIMPRSENNTKIYLMLRYTAILVKCLSYGEHNVTLLIHLYTSLKLASVFLFQINLMSGTCFFSLRH